MTKRIRRVHGDDRTSPLTIIGLGLAFAGLALLVAFALGVA